MLQFVSWCLDAEISYIGQLVISCADFLLWIILFVSFFIDVWAEIVQKKRSACALCSVLSWCRFVPDFVTMIKWLSKFAICCFLYASRDVDFFLIEDHRIAGLVYFLCLGLSRASCRDTARSFVSTLKTVFEPLLQQDYCVLRYAAIWPRLQHCCSSFVSALRTAFEPVL